MLSKTCARPLKLFSRFAKDPLRCPLLGRATQPLQGASLALLLLLLKENIDHLGCFEDGLRLLLSDRHSTG